MNLYDTAKEFSTRFNTEVAIPKSLPTQYDNVDFNLDSLLGEDNLWCRFTIDFDANFQTSIGVPGGNRFRRLGNAIAQVYMRLNKGDKEILQLADFIESKFRSLTISSLTLRTPETKIIGNNGDGYYQANVFCPFQTHILG